MSAIQWNLPGPDDPGFLRRRRDLLALLNADGTPENMDALAEYLVQFAAMDRPHDEVLVGIMDLSQRQYQAILRKLIWEGGGNVPDPLGDNSAGP